MANVIYTTFKENLLSQNPSIDFDADTIKAALVSSTYTPSAAHQYYSSVSGVVGTPGTLANKSTTGGAFDADDLTFTAVPVRVRERVRCAWGNCHRDRGGFASAASGRGDDQRHRDPGKREPRSVHGFGRLGCGAIRQRRDRWIGRTVPGPGGSSPGRGYRERDGDPGGCFAGLPERVREHGDRRGGARGERGARCPGLRLRSARNSRKRDRADYSRRFRDRGSFERAFRFLGDPV